MKNLFFLILLIATIACSVSKHNVQSVRKFEIMKTDTLSEFYVFKAMNDSSKEVIVIAEKDKVNDCKPFKRFIIADSIHETSVIKAGKGYDIVGFYLSTIDGIKIRTPGEPVKIIWNCHCFTEK